MENLQQPRCLLPPHYDLQTRKWQRRREDEKGRREEREGGEREKRIERKVLNISSFSTAFRLI